MTPSALLALQTLGVLFSFVSVAVLAERAIRRHKARQKWLCYKFAGIYIKHRVRSVVFAQRIVNGLSLNHVSNVELCDGNGKVSHNLAYGSDPKLFGILVAVNHGE